MNDKFAPQFAAVIILIVCLFALLTGCSTGDAASKPSSDDPKETTMSNQGTWAGDIFEAKIAEKTIVVRIKDEEMTSLYWDGSWADVQGHISSLGNRETLDQSLMGSQDVDKTFNVTEDEITFEFTMMGTTKTIHLKRVL